MESVGGLYGQPQQTVLTPPRGRLGHSLPTPRILEKGPIFLQEEDLDSHVEKIDTSFEKWPSRRDPFKPPVSPLYQIRSPLYDVKILESFKEEWDTNECTGDDSIVALTNRLVIDTGGDSGSDELDQRFTGDSLHSVSYKPSPLTPGPSTPGDDLGGSFVSAFFHSMNSSFTLPFVTSPTKDKDSFLFPTVARNPNKALLTIDARSSLILVTNDVTCNLFGYSKSDLVGLKIQHLFTEPYQSRQRALVEQNIDSTGETVLVSGKVMEAVTSYGLEFPVSVWMKKVSSAGAPDPRVIIVIEPVERCSLPFTIDDMGNIVDSNAGFATLFGYENDVVGQPLSKFIPSIAIPHISAEKQVSLEQSLTGRTRDGSAFPLEVIFTGTSIEPSTQMTNDCPLPTGGTANPCSGGQVRVLTHGKVVVYASLSGMLSINTEGCIEGCNHHFALMLFGYSQDELLKKDITFVMPNFYSHLTDIEEEDENETSVHPLFEQEVEQGQEISQSPMRDPLGRVSSSKEELFYSVSERSVSLDYALESHLASISEEGSDVFLSDPPNHNSSSSGGSVKCDSSLLLKSEGSGFGLETRSGMVEDQEVVIQFLPHVVTIGDRSFEYSSDGDSSSIADTSTALEQAINPTSYPPEPLLDCSKGDQPLSSTPCRLLSRPNSRLSSAPSRGGVYPEGTYTGSIRHKDGSLMSVVFELKHISLRNDRRLYCMWITRQLDCIVNDNSSTMDSMTRNHQGTPEALLGSSGITGTQEEAIATEGKYLEAYETLGPIGRGAFGFVKLAKRREDSLLVVVKFIKKETVISENWIENDSMGLVPREICLLANLNHPNIVQLLEAYENEQYFQLVMEKHGDGMDLFSFIESGPNLDEKLISYLFRQIVSGLSYLHQKQILHRDVKDENIILDHKFHIKIIDFGSAVMMGNGKLFNTFCGTLEYCSPEVLLGNSYAGPELEMWSLGVTLYTLVYNENPFFDVEEIISGRLLPPYLVSPGLMKLILWLLHPDPVSRATLNDLEKDKWVHQDIDISLYSFESVMEEPKNKGVKFNISIEERPKPVIMNRTLS